MKINHINTLICVSDFYKTNGKLPSQTSKDIVEKRLGLWIQTQKQAKKGKNKCKWNPILETLLNEFGLPEDLFEHIGNEQEAINTLKEVSDFYKNNGKLPSSSSKDPTEKSLGVWIIRTKHAKHGKYTYKWYHILEKMLYELGLPLDLFNYIDRELNAINVLKEVSEFYKTNSKLPSERSKDPKEKRLGFWVGTQKQAKKGTGHRNKWHPILESMLSELGLPLDLFEPIYRENIYTTTDKKCINKLNQKAINKLNEIAVFNKLYGKLPSQLAKDPKEKSLYKWIQNQKQAKKGKGTGNKWYPILEEMLPELGLPLDLFDNNTKKLP